MSDTASVNFADLRARGVEELAGRIHKDFLHNLKSARIWGSGAFEGQTVHRSHVLRDGDELGVGTPAPGPVTITKVMQEAAAKFGWDTYEKQTTHSHLLRGRGFAAGFKNPGISTDNRIV